MENNNVLKPILGAVIGSIPGLILWIIAGYFGYKIALLGLLIAGGIFFGYEKMGGYVSSVGGLIICIVVTIITVYLGAHIVWSMYLKAAFAQIPYISEVPLSYCIAHLYGFLELTDMKGSFFLDLFLDYLFAGIGAFGIIRKAAKG